ncbi:MAG TPA: hypothetical protein VKV19_13595, partial [Ktedonobacteraceae bacterium]|nr:hypothetical protein [Ktedonobacteraceae bacterium]
MIQRTEMKQCASLAIHGLTRFVTRGMRSRPGAHSTTQYDKERELLHLQRSGVMEHGLTQGDEPEPDEPTTRALVEAILAPLPERYLPITFERHDEGYLLQINFQMIFRGKPAREAIRRARDYVAEHQRAGWTLPA